MNNSNGQWIGYGIGDKGPQVTVIQHRLLKAYDTNSKAVSLGVTESGVYDQATADAVKNLQPFLNPPQAATGIANYGTQVAMRAYIPPAPTPKCVYFSVCGTGVPWNFGYCYDIGEALDKTRCFHQPIGYPAAGPPSAMGPSIDAGVTELIRQMDLHRCDITPWCGGGYSQGAIVWTQVLMRVMHGDLTRFKPMYMGSIAFGNPMREAGHSFPGCVPVPGQGIAQPNAVNTPAAHWDFSNVKTMVGSTGDDFYATMDGEADNSAAAADSRAVWAIIRDGLEGGLSLLEAVVKLAAEPSFSGGVGAATAIFYALDFFVVQGISPHVNYQNVSPIVGDPRDCWAIALGHIQDLVARLPVGAT
jgi:hypothetical protein